MSTIDAALPLADTVEERPDFGARVSELAFWFVRLRHVKLDRQIKCAPLRVCEPLGSDLAVPWQWPDLALDGASGADPVQ